MGPQRKRSDRAVILAILGGAVIVAVGLGVGLGIGLRDNDEDCNDTSSGGSSAKTYASKYGNYRHGAVAADSVLCSKIGTDIMAVKGGNAIDAAVAASLATGLVNAHSTGLGGGSFLIVYDSALQKWYAIDSRETAPAGATQDMFAGQIEKSLKGGLASGVPGELLGLYELHRHLGRLQWEDVVRPAIKLCKEGVPLTEAMHTAATSRLITPLLKQEFAPYVDNNGNIHPVGTPIKLPKLAVTFERILSDPYSFYNGSLAADIVADNNERGGIFTLDDLRNYKLKWTDPSVLSLPGGMKVYSINAPGSGPVLNYILNILSGYNFNPSDVADKDKMILTYHRIVEAFKFAYGMRTELGDEDFVDISQFVNNASSLEVGEKIRQQIDDSKTHDTAFYHPSSALVDDHGTTHLCVLDGEGNAVAITGTINLYFGSKVKGKRTGIVFNNEMNDFSVPNTTNYFGLPASPANFIAPGKRPMSSMSPTIVWDDNRKKVRMITGAAGGSKITTAVAMNIMDLLWFGRSNPESVDNKRFHHQLIPESIHLEKGFDEEIKTGLMKKGHSIMDMRGWTVLQSIDVTDEGIVAVSDHRKGGKPDGF